LVRFLAGRVKTFQRCFPVGWPLGRDEKSQGLALVSNRKDFHAFDKTREILAQLARKMRRSTASGPMKRILVDDLHQEWLKNADYKREYDALEEEFSLIAALIGARSRAGLTQEEVAMRMQSPPAVIARLEGGGCMPSGRALQKFAKATGSRLRIVFDPAGVQ
jgi:ribosome-binding protein aMBF1 (putative translation factor)